MRLAEPDPAIEEQRVEGRGRRFGDAARGGVGQLVRLADDEIVEREARIERRGKLRRFRRAHRLGGGLGLRLDARAARALGLDEQVDALDLGAFRAPQLADAVAVIAHHPVAHELGGHRDAQHAFVQVDQRQRLQPAAVRRVAHLGTQVAAHPRPIRVQFEVLVRCSRHAPSPPQGSSPAKRSIAAAAEATACPSAVNGDTTPRAERLPLRNHDTGTPRTPARCPERVLQATSASNPVGPIPALTCSRALALASPAARQGCSSQGSTGGDCLVSGGDDRCLRRGRAPSNEGSFYSR